MSDEKEIEVDASDLGHLAPGSPELIEEIVRRVVEAAEVEDDPEAIAKIRREVKEQFTLALLAATERAVKRHSSDRTRDETLDRLGVSQQEWGNVYRYVLAGLGVDPTNATKRMLRTVRDALLLGILIGIEFEEPDASSQSPADRAVMRRRRHGHHPTRKPDDR